MTMKQKLIARDIDRLEDVMMELEYDKELRDVCWEWLRNIRDDITSFLKEYDYEH